jgi:Mn2+/Fe2+ NRAMP family transporter
MPGVIAGAADLDPAAVLTATVTGIAFGYSVAWVVILCYPVLLTVLNVSARIGHQTRKGLVQLIREQHGIRHGAFIAGCMVAVNLAMIIGDLLAVSDACSLIMGVGREFFIAAIGFIVWYVLIVGDFRKTTKILGSMALITISYIVAAIHVTPSASQLVRGIIWPHQALTSAYFMGIVAVFGSLLTPDIIVWQASTKKDIQTGVKHAHIKESRAGALIACVISLSAIVASSQIAVANPSSMSTRQAAEALGTFGALGPVLFSLGIIGSGLIALPILVASLCFSVAEAFNWRSSLSMPTWDARSFYSMISAIVVVAVVVDFFHVNTVRVLYFSQVLAGVVLVPIFIYILAISNNRRVMSTTNSRRQNLWLKGAIAGMVIANFFSWFTLAH